MDKFGVLLRVVRALLVLFSAVIVAALLWCSIPALAGSSSALHSQGFGRARRKESLWTRLTPGQRHFQRLGPASDATNAPIITARPCIARQLRNDPLDNPFNVLFLLCS